MRAWIGVGGVWLALACGGAGGPIASLGPSAGPAAVALCEHQAKERDCPCEAVPVGSKAIIDDLEVEVLRVVKWEGSDSLPEIQNLDERNQFKATGKNALVVELAFTNKRPVKHDISLGLNLFTADGERRVAGPYNGQRYIAGKEGFIHLWDNKSLGPGRTAKVAMVYAVPAAEMDGALFWALKTEKRPDPQDPRGRMKTFTNEQVVLELPPP